MRARGRAVEVQGAGADRDGRGKVEGGWPGNRTRPPAWESNPAVLVEQLVDELDAVVGARAVDDLHVFGGDDEEGARQNVSCTGSVTLSGGWARALWRIGLVRWFVEATVEETPITWHENHKAHSRKRGSSPSTDGWDVAAVWVDGLGLAARSTEHAVEQETVDRSADAEPELYTRVQASGRTPPWTELQPVPMLKDRP